MTKHTDAHAQKPVTIRLSAEQAEQWQDHGYIILDDNDRVVESHTVDPITEAQELRIMKEQTAEAKQFSAFLAQSLGHQDDINLTGDAAKGFHLLCAEIESRLEW